MSAALLLPRAQGEWSLAWDGREGYLRSGAFEGIATDCGDREAPPLALQFLIEEAAARNAQPRTLVIYSTVADALPKFDAWQRKLGVPLRDGGRWDVLTAAAYQGKSLAPQRRAAMPSARLLQRLKPAALIIVAALVLHAIALTAEWIHLSAEQSNLRSEMETTFRASFPQALAIADPALQMRRKLAEFRHAAGQPDSGDFLNMMEAAGRALQPLPTGSVQTASYENGRLTLELGPNGTNSSVIRNVANTLIQAGMKVETTPSPRTPGATVMTVRAP